ncbi:MAG: nitroreductase family protein [Clostridiales bacterium]|nr:nitroreductase family protein [Clostridiales bacterium]
MDFNIAYKLNNAISKRRSFRSFIQETLDDALMEDLIDFISALEPPAGDEIDWNFDTLPYIDMVKICSREPGIKAPHYLVLRAERKQFCLQMSAYIGEMAILFLTSKGVATRWLGNMDIAEDFPDTLPFVAAIAFGRSEEEFRDGSYLDRLPANKTCFGQYAKYRDIMDAARFAPSEQNKQPCAFIADERSNIHVYRKKVLFNNPIISYAQCLDSGVAMAHLQVAAIATGHQYAELYRLSSPPIFKNMIYQGTLAVEGRK